MNISTLCILEKLTSAVALFSLCFASSNDILRLLCLILGISDLYKIFNFYLFSGELDIVLSPVQISFNKFMFYLFFFAIAYGLIAQTISFTYAFSGILMITDHFLMILISSKLNDEISNSNNDCNDNDIFI